MFADGFFAIAGTCGVKTAGPAKGGEPKTAEKPVRLNDKNKALGDHLRDQLMTALGTAALEDVTPVGGGHAFAESVSFFPDNVGRGL